MPQVIVNSLDADRKARTARTSSELYSPVCLAATGNPRIVTLGNRSSRRRISCHEGSLVAHSSRASRMASCTRGRTWRMACDMRLGQVRLVSNVTESWRVGSIQTEVPVNPRCPKDAAEKCEPDDAGGDGVS